MHNRELQVLASALAAALKLQRPLAVLDLETTGLNPDIARIVELAVLRIEPSGASRFHSRRVNPQEPIPPEATAIHGIAADDVAGELAFAAIAGRLARFLDGCDLAGFNIAEFDMPVLAAEFRRAGREFSGEHRYLVDAYGIFCHYESRDLPAALRFYTGREIEDAHSAAGDVVTTMRVLRGQLHRYGDLPREVAELHKLSVREHIVWKGDEPYLTFGKHAGRALQQAVLDDPGYFDWILAKGTFPLTLTDAIRQCRAAAHSQQ